MKKLTKEQITEVAKKIKAGTPPPLPGNHKSTYHWFADFSGFGIRQNGGQGSWILKYRLHGRGERITLGDVRKSSFNDAFDRAKKLWADVELNRADPQRAKREAMRAAATNFRDVVESFLASRRVRSSTLGSYKRHLQTGYYFEALHGKQFDTIKPREISECLTKVEQASGNEAAALAHRNLTSMFNWAIGKTDFHSGPSPMLKVEAPKRNASRERVLDDDEIRTMLAKHGRRT